ncbi:ABC transporter permease [Egicoccus sp. AB-alg2]|uniref:ABC transporter permease n=1 Tax=Egicoccus sp. AB-alg2 TaxID=3242693 RepID=UPI00359EF50B
MATATIRPTTPLQRLGLAVRNLSPFGTFSVVLALALAGLAIIPLGRVVLGLFYVDGALTLAPLRATLAVPDLARLLTNTVVAVAVSGVIALLIGAVFAWLNERTDARMGFATDALPLLPFLLPPVAGAVGWVLLLSPRAGLLNAWLRDFLGLFGINLAEGPFDIHSWYGLIAIYAVYQVPYAFLLLSAGLRNMDPALEEQSRMSGAGLVRTLRKVTLPAMAPSMGAAVLLMVWTGFGIFSLPAIVGTPAGIDVLAVRIVRLLSFTYPPETDVAIGLSVFVVLFVAIAYTVQLRLLRAGRHATVGGKGHKTKRIELGRWRWPARLLMLAYVMIAAVLPIGALVLVSLNGFWTPDIAWGDLSTDAFQRAVFGDRVTQRALRNSLLLGVGGGLIGITAAAVIALFVARTRSTFARVLDGSIKLPAAISNIVIAVGVVLVFAGPPFRLGGTLIILLMGYLALYMPQGSVAADAAAGQVGKELPEASHVSGAGRGRTFRKVYLPLMVPGLVAGWALLFIRMAGDLTASAILAGTRNPVVGFRILEVYQGGSYAMLAALSTVLVLITSTVLVLVTAYTRRRSKWGIETKIGGVG